MSRAPGVSEEQMVLLREGAQLYNEGQFWEAHEAWEEVWLDLRADDRDELADLVQALILTTAAFENLDRGKPGGFATQGAKALHRFRAQPDGLAALGVREGQAFVDELLSVYLHVQRLGVDELGELALDVPLLAIDV